MVDDIIELHRALQAARGLDTTTERYKIHTANVQDIRALSAGNGNDNSSTNYGSRTASITREQQDEREKRKQMIQRDVIQLFDEGYTVDQVAYFLEGYASPSEVARIAEYNQRRRKFLMTGNLDLPGQMAGITIG